MGGIVQKRRQSRIALRSAPGCRLAYGTASARVALCARVKIKRVCCNHVFCFFVTPDPCQQRIAASGVKDPVSDPILKS